MALRKKMTLRCIMFSALAMVSLQAFCGGPTPAAMPAPMPAPMPVPMHAGISSSVAHAVVDSASINPEDTQKSAAIRIPSLNPSLTKEDFGRTEFSRQAFTKMLQQEIPLSPKQIKTLHQLFDQSQRAVARPAGVPPKPTSSSLMVNMSPGATPPTIRLRAGYVSSLVFLDSTGQPWPIIGYDLGNPKAFNIQPSQPNGKSNTLIIQSINQYAQGNLAVMLKGENTPVMLTMISGQRAVDYRVDLRIPGLGPNAVINYAGLPGTENPQLLAFLDGTPPQGAKRLVITGAPAQAWKYAGQLVVRTRVTILSPGWVASINSPDGTYVYQLPQTPVLLASQRGAMIRLHVKGI